MSVNSYKAHEYRPGATVKLASGGPIFTVISEQDWLTACEDRARPEFVPCMTWLNNEPYYHDFPATALEYVDYK